ncbi:MAG: hypothetical protein KDK99_06420 [Verrucomicrobiales bacterium]|nr:hypothetical protein [Verrucomicrobiales bacterium]
MSHRPFLSFSHRFIPGGALAAVAGLTALISLFLPTSAEAYNRRFVYSYEAGGMPQGLLEFEPWFTYKNYGDGFAWDFRYELEYAVTDNLIIAAYLSDWRYSDRKGKSEAEWKTAGMEVLYTLSNPTADWIGSALYGEFLIGPEKFALEGKVILNKTWGPLSVVYNGILEAEWEGEDYSERVGVIENTLGASYQFNPKFFVGVEALHEVELEDWSNAGQHGIYVGPNVSYRTSGVNQPGKGSFFATAALLFQATDIDDEPESQVRLIFGYFF